MCNKIKVRYSLFVAALISGSSILPAQTLYVPSGTSGIGSSSNGNVGIGTANPQYSLDVSGAGLRVINGNGNAAQLNLAQTTGGHDWALVSWGSAAGGGGLSNKFSLYDNTSGGHRLTVDALGNVGMGTTSPVTRLHLVGPFTPAYMQLALQASGSDNRSGISFLNAAGSRVGSIYVGDGGDFIFGRDQAGEIRFFSNGAERVTIDSAGNVGIGTRNQGARLDLQANGGPALRVFDGFTDTSTVDFRRTVDGWYLGQMKLVHAGNYGANLIFSLHPNDGTQPTAPSEVMRIVASGNVGIGTTNPTHKLAVNGTIRAKEVIVDTGWSDYVFKPEYKLASLSEVEGAIQRDGHLPGIPSAQEVAEHGVSMGEMQAKLLAKIEELTLHQIAQEKRLNEQTALLNQQAAQLGTQSTRLHRLEQENATLRSTR